MTDVRGPRVSDGLADLQPLVHGVDTLDSRWERACGPLAWTRTAPAEPHQRDWMRLRNFAPTGDAFIEAGRYAMFLDTFSWPTAAHAHAGDRPFIAPTLSFAIDFHAYSDGEWLLSDAHSPHAGDDGLAIHDRVWSPSGERSWLRSASAIVHGSAKTPHAPRRHFASRQQRRSASWRHA